MSDLPTLPHTSFVPLDPSISVYGMIFGNAQPLQYSGWQDEVLSWKKTAYIHGGLNPTQTYRIWGPDALRLLSEHCVNSFAKFSIGAAKHAVMCNDNGFIEAHGVLVRKGEEEFLAYWLAPWLPHVVANSNYDVRIEDLTGKFFLFQVAGPRSLEILAAATKDDLRDIRFLRQRTSQIAGTEVELASVEVDILRVGMAGSLAYELHGPIEQAHAVYNAILKAGEPFGLRRLGWWQYQMNHTESGFPQSGMHFLLPCMTVGEFPKHFNRLGRAWSSTALRGSASGELELNFRNPVDVGWGHLIKFDHEFQGREALESEVRTPKRKMVTLVWDAEDILDIYRSYFTSGDPLPFMEFTRESLGPFVSDFVMSNGKVVGVSVCRVYSYYYRCMISLCSIDIDESNLGNEVVIVRGEPGSRQKEVRATVERYPFYDEDRNETIDVGTIARPGEKSL